MPNEKSLSPDLPAAALSYAARNWRVFPCHPRKKAPLGKLAPHGCRDATTDADTIRAWWRQSAEANVAVATGDGLLVLDADGDKGRESLKGLPLPLTPIAETGGGGLHYYFAAPAGAEIGCAVGVRPGIDVRGAGGYVVAPPSRHPSGGQYLWASDLSPEDVALAPAPEWLLEALEKRGTSPRAAPLPETIAEGERNVRLTSLAGSLRRQGMSQEAIQAALRVENKNRCAPPLLGQEVKQIAASVARYEPAAPADPQGLAREAIHLTDTGNAERLVAQHGKDLRYCWPWHKWVVWNGKVWKVDAGAQVSQRAKRTVRAMYREAGRQTNDDRRAKLGDFALKSENVQRRKAMMELTRSEPEVACDPALFDTDPYLLCCGNGTIDLRTGARRRHQREDYLTKLAPGGYDPQATCPKWEAFLQGVFEGNTRLIEFVQRAAGYSLTGDVSEDALFFLHGGGANGKSTFFLTLQGLLGAYAIQISPGLLLTQRYESHPTGLADLFGIRLAVSVEVGEGRRFDEERLKQLTGGDRIRARRMGEDFWEFEPTHKVWLAANAKPRVTGQDYAIWRRIHLIPFNVKFTPQGGPPPNRDESLRQNLFREERPGLLNWALEGCLSWQREGLLPPPEVQTATAAYQQEEDTVEQFIEAECVVALEARENPTLLFKAYERWRKETGATQLALNTFGTRLTQKGFLPGRDRNARWRAGLALAVGGDQRFDFRE